MDSNSDHPYMKFEWHFPPYHGTNATIPGKTMTYITTAETLDHVFDDFKQFLLGCGYIIKGEIGEIDEFGERMEP